MNQFSIKDVEALTGIKSHTLRIWELRYGIPQPKRSDTNIRSYDNEDVRLLLNVAMLNRQGLKISRITKMTRSDIEHAVMELSENSNDYSVQLESLVSSMFNLDELAFEKVLSANVQQKGIETTYLEIVFPFLLKVGILWQTGSINPAYEHFISNLIRQKLFVAIDALPKKMEKKSKKFVLFLPSNEPHELGLLFANYLVRSKGNHTSYLGANLPLDDLGAVMKVYKADFILTVLTNPVAQNNPLLIAKKLAADFPQSQILISGSLVVKSNYQLPSNVRFLYSIDDLVGLLDKI